MKASCDRVTLKKFKGACRQPRRRAKAHSVYMYKIKASATVSDGTAVPRRLPAEGVAQVGSEAARLAKFNRLRVITRREVHAALRALRPRKNAEKVGA